MPNLIKNSTSDQLDALKVYSNPFCGNFKLTQVNASCATPADRLWAALCPPRNLTDKLNVAFEHEQIKRLLPAFKLNAADSASINQQKQLVIEALKLAKTYDHPAKDPGYSAKNIVRAADRAAAWAKAWALAYYYNYYPAAELQIDPRRILLTLAHAVGWLAYNETENTQATLAAQNELLERLV